MASDFPYAPDDWGTLGIRPSDGLQAAREAYRRLAMSLHPDRTGGDPAKEEMLKVVNLAWDNIRNGISPTRHIENPHPHPHANPVRWRRGRDITVAVSIDIAEAFTGTRRTLRGKGRQACPSCLAGESRCQRCGGSGFVLAEWERAVVFPRGCSDGEKMTIPGLGETGLAGDGDMLVSISILDPSGAWSVSGRDISSTIQVEWWVPDVGARIPVTLPSGRVLSLSIPAGSRDGDLLRIPAMGIPGRRGQGDGDALVRLSIAPKPHTTPSVEDPGVDDGPLPSPCEWVAAISEFSMEGLSWSPPET